MSLLINNCFNEVANKKIVKCLTKLNIESFDDLDIYNSKLLSKTNNQEDIFNVFDYKFNFILDANDLVDFICFVYLQTGKFTKLSKKTRFTYFISKNIFNLSDVFKSKNVPFRLFFKQLGLNFSLKDDFYLSDLDVSSSFYASLSNREVLSVDDIDYINKDEIKVNEESDFFQYFSKYTIVTARDIIYIICLLCKKGYGLIDISFKTKLKINYLTIIQYKDIIESIGISTDDFMTFYNIRMSSLNINNLKVS